MQLVLSELYYTLIRFKCLLHGVKLSSTTLFTCQIQTVFSGLLIPLWGQTLFIFFYIYRREYFNLSVLYIQFEW